MHLRGWGPDSGRWGRFMKAVKLFADLRISDPTKTKIYKRLALWSACVYADHKARRFVISVRTHI